MRQNIIRLSCSQLSCDPVGIWSFANRGFRSKRQPLPGPVAISTVALDTLKFRDWCEQLLLGAVLRGPRTTRSDSYWCDHMGCFLETLFTMIGAVPRGIPVILHFGIDPVWFGLFPVIMMQLALITPPVGINLCGVQGACGRGERADVYCDTLPFVRAMLVWVAPIIIWPQIVMITPVRV